MTDLTAFEITARWPAANPDVIQLYSYPTPNGTKVSIALEELGLAYEPHLVTLAAKDVRSQAFLSLNPNNKIPAIIDPDGPGGKPMGLFESGAILIYLAEKTGRLLGDTPEQKYQAIQWVMFQIGGVGPMFGQLEYFVKFAGSEIEDPRPRDRFVAEAKRLLAVVDNLLGDRASRGEDWIIGPFSIADIALAPWLGALEHFGAAELVGLKDLRNVPAYLERFNARPAVVVGRKIPAKDP